MRLASAIAIPHRQTVAQLVAEGAASLATAYDAFDLLDTPENRAKLSDQQLASWRALLATVHSARRDFEPLGRAMLACDGEGR